MSDSVVVCEVPRNKVSDGRMVGEYSIDAETYPKVTKATFVRNTPGDCEWQFENPELGILKKDGLRISILCD
jgi:hypothetical protein